MRDLIGFTTGKLTVIEKTDKRTPRQEVIWKCRCECGDYAYIKTSHLTSGHRKSCGCLGSRKYC